MLLRSGGVVRILRIVELPVERVELSSTERALESAGRSSRGWLRLAERIRGKAPPRRNEVAGLLLWASLEEGDSRQPRRETTVLRSAFGLESGFMIGRSVALMVGLYSSKGAPGLCSAPTASRGGSHPRATCGSTTGSWRRAAQLQKTRPPDLPGRPVVLARARVALQESGL